jgi:ribosomal protein S18 acetylase RimI-like enzyme
MKDNDNKVEIQRIDLTEIDLAVDLFDKYRIFYKQDSNLELAKAFLTERLKNDESVIYIAFTNNGGIKEPIGFMQLYPRWFSITTIIKWYISDLYVESDYRKKGIGSELLKTAIDFGKSQNASIVTLHTAKDNFTAQKVYESLGFIQREEFPKAFFYQFDLKD